MQTRLRIADNLCFSVVIDASEKCWRVASFSNPLSFGLDNDQFAFLLSFGDGQTLDQVLARSTDLGIPMAELSQLAEYFLKSGVIRECSTSDTSFSQMIGHDQIALSEIDQATFENYPARKWAARSSDRKPKIQLPKTRQNGTNRARITKVNLEEALRASIGTYALATFPIPTPHPVEIRPYPSNGCRHPLRCLIAYEVGDGLRKVAPFDPLSGSLRFASDADALKFDQADIKSVEIIVAADVLRSMDRYRDSRTFYALFLEAGHLLENILEYTEILGWHVGQRSTFKLDPSIRNLLIPPLISVVLADAPSDVEGVDVSALDAFPKMLRNAPLINIWSIRGTFGTGGVELRDTIRGTARKISFADLRERILTYGHAGYLNLLGLEYRIDEEAWSLDSRRDELQTWQAMGWGRALDYFALCSRDQRSIQIFPRLKRLRSLGCDRSALATLLRTRRTTREFSEKVMSSTELDFVLSPLSEEATKDIFSAVVLTRSETSQMWAVTLDKLPLCHLSPDSSHKLNSCGINQADLERASFIVILLIDPQSTHFQFPQNNILTAHLNGGMIAQSVLLRLTALGIEGYVSHGVSLRELPELKSRIGASIPFYMISGGHIG